MYTDATENLPQSGAAYGTDIGVRKTRVGQCGHQDECKRMKTAWCASTKQMRLTANHLLTIQENERKRIASDLHDGLGQSLNMIKFTLAETERLLANGMIGEMSQSLAHLKCKIHGVIDEVRHAAMDLRPPILDDLGILPTLSWFLRELETVCPNMRTEKDFNIEERDIPEPLKITIYRIIQEASNNIIKHANADLIKLNLKRADDALHLIIEDNGEGFDPASVRIRQGSDRGLGLLSMKERATLTGGIYVMTSMPGAGTRIRVMWKYESAAGNSRID